MAAGGPEAARLAARKTDGLVVTEPKPELVEAFRSANGNGPRYAEVSMCWAPSEDEARKTAHHYFRWAVTGWPVQAELPNTRGFAAATRACDAGDRGAAGDLRPGGGGPSATPSTSTSMPATTTSS